MKRYIFMPGIFCLILVVFKFVLFIPGDALGGAYLSSAHGNGEYGVSRTSMAPLTGFGYARGLCAHCHEQHTTVDGAEPEPSGGPVKYTLFAQSFVSQTDNFCMKCHDSTSAVAYPVINRSYSYRAGGWTDDLLDSIVKAFDNPPNVSSHNLNDIRSFIVGQMGWNYTAESNPCAACHNPHSAQRDPKTTTRGWPVSRPSQHNRNNNTWGLWGDDLPTGSSERMSDYIAANGGVYQAPYYFYFITPFGYEPDNSATTNGSNLTDFVTFCTDCHSSNIVWSSGGDAHGGKNSASPNVNLPYQNPVANNHVLACTDCHEPHGSPNPFLLRTAVNGQAPISVTGGAFYNFCNACHPPISFTGTHAGLDINSTCSTSNCHHHGGIF